jgi:IS5 family transposase
MPLEARSCEGILQLLQVLLAVALRPGSGVSDDGNGSGRDRPQLHSRVDSGYTGADKRVQRKKLETQIAAKRGKIKAMADGREKHKLEKIQKRKASVRAKVEHSFRVIKRKFGLMKVRFRRLAKNTAHVITLFALSNLWRARRRRLAMTG